MVRFTLATSRGLVRMAERTAALAAAKARSGKAMLVSEEAMINWLKPWGIHGDEGGEGIGFA